MRKYNNRMRHSRAKKNTRKQVLYGFLITLLLLAVFIIYARGWLLHNKAGLEQLFDFKNHNNIHNKKLEQEKNNTSYPGYSQEDKLYLDDLINKNAH